MSASLPAGGVDGVSATGGEYTVVTEGGVVPSEDGGTSFVVLLGRGLAGLIWVGQGRGYSGRARLGVGAGAGAEVSCLGLRA